MHVFFLVVQQEKVINPWVYHRQYECWSEEYGCGIGIGREGEAGGGWHRSGQSVQRVAAWRGLEACDQVESQGFAMVSVLISSLKGGCWWISIGSYSLFSCIMWGYDGLASSVGLPPRVSRILCWHSRSFSLSVDSDKIMAPNLMGNMSSQPFGNSDSEVEVYSASSSVAWGPDSLPRNGDVSPAWASRTVSFTHIHEAPSRFWPR